MKASHHDRQTPSRSATAGRSAARERFAIDQAIPLLFEYVHNLKVGVLVVAAGLLASQREWAAEVALPPVIGSRAVGFVVAGIGIGLIALNLLDGARKLRGVRPGLRLAARIGLAALSVLVTFRVVQVLVLLRLH